MQERGLAAMHVAEASAACNPRGGTEPRLETDAEREQDLATAPGVEHQVWEGRRQAFSVGYFQRR